MLCHAEAEAVEKPGNPPCKQQNNSISLTEQPHRLLTSQPDAENICSTKSLQLASAQPVELLLAVLASSVGLIQWVPASYAVSGVKHASSKQGIRAPNRRLSRMRLPHWVPHGPKTVPRRQDVSRRPIQGVGGTPLGLKAAVRLPDWVTALSLSDI